LAEILLVDADPALRGLLEEWLQPQGHRVVEAGAADLVVVDIPHPRRDGLEVLQRVAREHPRAPRLVLSSSFFPGVDCGGAVAHSLGVAGVLPKPLTREALLAAVQRLTRAGPGAK
jgi:CheY-like chemotaxis protein